MKTSDKLITSFIVICLEFSISQLTYAKDLENESKNICNQENRSDDLVLSCYREHGYPYAAFCDRDGHPEICPGPLIHYGNVKFNSDLRELNKVIQDVAGIKSGQIFKQSVAVEAARNLENHLGLRNVEIKYYPTIERVVDAEIFAEPPKSRLSFGGYYSNNQVSIIAEGQHFADYIVPGFIDYKISLVDDGYVSEAHLGVPLAYKKAAKYTATYDYSNLEYKNYKLVFSKYGIEGDDLKHFSDAFSIDSAGVSIVQPKMDVSFQNTKELTYANAYMSFKYDVSKFNSTIYFTPIVFGDENQNMSGLFNVKNRTLVTLSEKNRIKMRAHFNGSVVIGRNGNIPLSERIYLGGQNSLRGFEANEIGSTSQNIEQWGGKRAASLQFEVIKSFNLDGRELNLGIHYDAGVIDFSDDSNEKYMSSGVIAELGLGPDQAANLNVSKQINGEQRDWQLFLGITFNR